MFICFKFWRRFALKTTFERLILVAILLVSLPCFAKGISQEKLKELLKKKFTGKNVRVEKFSTPPYLVVSIDGRFFLMDPKNELVFPGVFSLIEGKDLLKPYKERYISRISKSINLRDFIHYTKKPKKGAKRVLLFTDPKCPFCKKVFTTLKKRADAGDIDLYLGFIPVHRNAKQVEEILCSKDPALSYANIVTGGKEELKPCKNGAEKLLKMVLAARKAGYGNIWRGVPTVIGLNGEGYVVGADIEGIERLLGEKKKK